MKLAIIGSGISGLTCAHLLHPHHDLTVFEADSHVGGHTHTHDITHEGRPTRVDTGFIVFNERTYPNFVRLLDRLGVASRPTSMSFSVRCERTGLEYCGSSLGALFAQRRNALSPGFWDMLRSMLRFNAEARAFARDRTEDAETSLGDFLARGRYGRRFEEHYIVPMASAIWSASRDQTLAIPMLFFARFFANHGMLNVFGRPVWRVVEGGSRAYVDRLIEPFRDHVRTGSAVRRLRRDDAGVEIGLADGSSQQFDAAIVACHADQALDLLDDPTDQEREVLGAFRFQRNRAVLHTDARLMPRSRRAWAAWNYHLPAAGVVAGASVTYCMNILQHIPGGPLCVTLNREADIDPARVITRIDYAHPVFTKAAIAAQSRQREINGPRRTYFCGAYWRYGFHEDGVMSAQAVCRAFGASL